MRPTLSTPIHDRKERMTVHNFLHGAADALALCILASNRALFYGGLEHWIAPSRPPNGMYDVRDALRSWATPVRDSAEGKAMRHFDTPSAEGLGYIMSGHPQ
jgi:hypothetical protein